MFKPDPNDTKPCWHMRTLVSSLADNQLSGVLRRFTQMHINSCPQCQHGLATVQAMRARLGRMDESADHEADRLSPPRWVQVENAWEQTDVVTPPISQP